MYPGARLVLKTNFSCESRAQKATKLATLKTKLELPMATKGSAIVGTAFSGDYLPMIAHILKAGENMQEGRGSSRRVSRRHHYLRDLFMDMTVVDDIRELQYRQELEST
jgi:hypothetical protein